MKTTHSKWYAFAGLAFAALLFSAWQTTGSTLPVKPYLIRYDDDTTVPRKKSYDKNDFKTGDLDRAMKDLDRAMLDMDKNIKFDFSKMDKEMKLAMEEIKKIDFEKISKDVAASLKEVNWEKTRAEVDKALREVDMKKIEKEIARAKEEVKDEKISSYIDMEQIKKSVEQGLAGARIGIEKARKELLLLKEFTTNLEKDGLINKKKGYKIEIKSGELYINDTKQSKEVNDRYRKYFKEEDFTIKSDGDDISNL